MILLRSSKTTKTGVLGSLFVSKMFTTHPAFICYNAITEELRRSMLLWIMGQHGGSGNSFEVRLTSSGLDNGIDGPGITWGVYAIDSMDTSACANAHCPRLRAEARGEWHFPANVLSGHS